MNARARSGSTPCRIEAVGKRRDGGTKFWCLEHKADATAKYGRRSPFCRYAHISQISESEKLAIRLPDYPGGVAVWGAVAPVYDTTDQSLDRGIHVHARREPHGIKEIDATFRSVTLQGHDGALTKIEISELDAIYFMVSSVFGFTPKEVNCSLCGFPHLDKDWFSVHEHGRHLCAGCGRQFRDTTRAIGNPLIKARKVFGIEQARTVLARQSVKIAQADYPGGIQIWGSNPAIFWNSSEAEEEGIHLHAFDRMRNIVKDDTYSNVTIDGVILSPLWIRTLMAQSALPHLSGRIVNLECAGCGEPHFDAGSGGFTPCTEHLCGRCGGSLVARGRLRKVIGNPARGTLERLAKHSVRLPREHDLNLLPETL